MILKETPISTVMTDDIITIDSELTVQDAQNRMADNEIRHLPVMRDDDLIGMVSARDLLLFDTLPFPDVRELPITVAMSAYPVTCDENTSIQEVLETMRESGIGAMPITSSDRLTGIFTTVDALNLLSIALV